MKILAIDYGLKRIGLAVGSPILQTATPIEPIIRKNSDQLLQALAECIQEYDISKIIIGYPVHMDGTKSETARQVDNLVARIRNKLNIETELVDERLSSFEADQLMKTHANYQTGYKKRKKHLDSMSAAVILRHYLDVGNRENRPPETPSG